MRPLQFRALLRKAKLSQSEAARRIGISDRTMRRYLAGSAPVPQVVVLAVLHVLDEHRIVGIVQPTESQRTP